MFLSYFFLCFSVLLQSSISGPIEATKPEPVALAHSCMTVTSGDGHQDKTPILLLHGLGMSKETWMGIFQILALKTGRRVCIADLRNHGDSPWSDEADVAANAEDVSRLLKTLNIPKVIILGHSLGGKISMHFTLNYPERVEKLIVEDMRPNGVTPEGILGVQAFLRLLQSSLEAIPKGVSEKEAKEAVVDYLNEQLKKQNSTELLVKKAAYLLPLKCSDERCEWKINPKLVEQVFKDLLALFTESTGRYDGPVLVVYGTKSPIKVKEDESSILKLFPNAKLVGVEGAGHIVRRHPEFLESVLKFINEQE